MAHQYIGTGYLGANQVKAYTTTATIDNAVGAGVYKVRVVVTSAAYIKIGKDATATTSDVYMPADSPEYFTIRPGEKVASRLAFTATAIRSRLSTFRTSSRSLNGTRKLGGTNNIAIGGGTSRASRTLSMSNGWTKSIAREIRPCACLLLNST